MSPEEPYTGFLFHCSPTPIYGIKPTDPLTLVVVAMVLGMVATVASIVPAVRATGVDPLQVLREE